MSSVNVKDARFDFKNKLTLNLNIKQINEKLNFVILLDFRRTHNSLMDT